MQQPTAIVLPLAKPDDEPRPSLGRLYLDRSTALGSEVTRESERLAMLRRLEQSDVQARQKNMHRLQQSLQSADLSLSKRHKQFQKRRERINEEFKQKKEKASAYLDRQNRSQIARYLDYRAELAKQPQNPELRTIEMPRHKGNQYIKKRESNSLKKSIETRQSLFQSLRESESRYEAERAERAAYRQQLFSRVSFSSAYRAVRFSLENTRVQKREIHRQYLRQS